MPRIYLRVLFHPASSVLAAFLLCLTPAWAASSAAALGSATFAEHCAECHGADAAGALGPPLDGPYMYGDGDQSVTASIRDGFAPNMPAFGKVLSAAQIKSLVEFLKIKVAEAPPRPPAVTNARPRTAGIMREMPSRAGAEISSWAA